MNNVYKETVDKLREASAQMSMSSGDPKKLAEEFAREHNTNQQSIIRLLQGMIVEVSKWEHGIDLRNEDSVNWCKEVAEKPAHFPFI